MGGGNQSGGIVVFPFGDAEIGIPIFADNLLTAEIQEEHGTAESDIAGHVQLHVFPHAVGVAQEAFAGVVAGNPPRAAQQVAVELVGECQHPLEPVVEIGIMEEGLVADDVR